MNVIQSACFKNLISYGESTYSLDTKLRDMLNKAFDANIVDAWSRDMDKSVGKIDVGSGGFIILKSNGDYAKLQSSEYCVISY